jgi:hypothetical protein
MHKLLVFLLVTGFACGVSYSAHATPYLGADIELLGSDYSDISSLASSSPEGWFIGDEVIWTNWDNQWVEYKSYLDTGNWNIGVNVINNGNIGSGWYTAFEISSELLGETSTTIVIPASDTEVNHGFFNYDVTASDLYTVRYTWLNDKWGGVGSTLDANIQINSAFFDNTATAPVPEPATMLLLGCGLIGLAVVGRKKLRRG